MQEIWRPVNGWETKYEVSSMGRVKRIRTGKILTPMITGAKRSGAQRAKVRFSTSPRCDYDVAHLVLATFVGERIGDEVAMHNDDNPLNNMLTNLKWGSRKDNAVDMAKRVRGGFQKLNANQCLEIQLARAGGESGKSVALRFGISVQRVCDIFKGRTSFKEKTG